MLYTKTEQKLIDAMAEMDIIDSHEHLPPEADRLARPQDVFTLFSHYTRYDLMSAGMAAKSHDALFDYDTPLDQRWKTFKPFWQHIRYGTYARPALLAAELVYGIDDINDRTYAALSERIAAENTPGIYRRMLCDRCRIRLALTQCNRTDVEKPLVPVMPGFQIAGLRSRAQMEKLAQELGRATPKNLDEYLDLTKAILARWLAEGTVGIKILSTHNVPADRPAAEKIFKRLLDGQELVQDSRRYEPLEDFLRHQVIDYAAELDLTVAVHAGVWGDFRSTDPKFMLTLSPEHPQATFDLYHLGMPFIRDAIMVGKNLANVRLNLCWTHILSQVQSSSGIDELLDQVPVNKVLAFGGDYVRPVENVVGHLHMARENFAGVFGRRIDRGLMSFDQAVGILKLWFWDNAFSIYPRLQAD